MSFRLIMLYMCQIFLFKPEQYSTVGAYHILLIIHPAMDISVVSSFWLSWIMSLCTWMYKYLFQSLLSTALSESRVPIFSVSLGMEGTWALRSQPPPFPPEETVVQMDNRLAYGQTQLEAEPGLGPLDSAKHVPILSRCLLQCWPKSQAFGIRYWPNPLPTYKSRCLWAFPLIWPPAPPSAQSSSRTLHLLPSTENSSGPGVSRHPISPRGPIFLAGAQSL